MRVYRVEDWVYIPIYDSLKVMNKNLRLKMFQDLTASNIDLFAVRLFVYYFQINGSWSILQYT